MLGLWRVSLRFVHESVGCKLCLQPGCPVAGRILEKDRYPNTEIGGAIGRVLNDRLIASIPVERRALAEVILQPHIWSYIEVVLKLGGIAIGLNARAGFEAQVGSERILRVMKL